MAHWNHRLMLHEHEHGSVLKIHEIYYNDLGIPDSYTENGIGPQVDLDEGIEGINWILDKMKECLKLPILYYGDKFPEEYKPEK